MNFEPLKQEIKPKIIFFYTGRSSEIQPGQSSEPTQSEAYQPSEAFSSDDETRENLIQELQNELGGNLLLHLISWEP